MELQSTAQAEPAIGTNSAVPEEEVFEPRVLGEPAPNPSARAGELGLHALAQLDKAKHALEKARTLPEVMKIKDISEAARVYAKAAHLGRESQNHAAEIALLASRKAGRFLKQLQKSRGGRPATAGNRTAATVTAVSYSEALRSTHTKARTARRWQKLAEVPEETVRAYINTAHSKESEEEITAAGLLRKAKAGGSKPAQQPVTEKDRKRKLFAFATKLYEDVAPENRERELRMLTNELLAHFSVSTEAV